MFVLIIVHKSKLKMTTKTNLVNKEAFEIGKFISTIDRRLIVKKLNVKPNIVDKVLQGNRKAIRGKSLQIIEMAKKLAEINQQKAELI